MQKVRDEQKIKFQLNTQPKPYWILRHKENVHPYIHVFIYLKQFFQNINIT